MQSRIKRINNLLERESWDPARRLIKAELRRAPNDHWLLTKLGSTFYEERSYRRALKLSKQALAIQPRCPLVLWNYACALDMLGRDKDAIKVLKKLLDRGERDIAYGECGEGIRWARSLLNDCRYRIGRLHRDMGDLKSAVHALKDHLAHRAPGTPSLYSLARVKRDLASFKALTRESGSRA